MPQPPRDGRRADPPRDALHGVPRGLARRALRDLQAGIAAGRFQATEPRLARAAVAGALLATLQMALAEPALVDDAAIDHLAEQVLRMLGTPYDEAYALAHAPLPVAELPEPVDSQS